MNKKVCLLTIVLIFTFQPFTSIAKNIIDLGIIKVPVIKIVDIQIASLDDNILVLTAIRNDKDSNTKVLWRIKGSSHGYTLSDTNNKSRVNLKIGNEEQTITVEACVSNGYETGGCKTIAINSVVIDQSCSDTRWQEIKGQEWDDYLCLGNTDDSYKYIFFKVRSRVNTVTGEYLRDKKDISVKVAGGFLTIERKYSSKTGWQFEHEKHNLKLKTDKNDQLLIIKNNVTYKPSPKEPNTFVHNTYKIIKNDNTFWFEDKQQRWKKYDKKGKILAFGNRTGTIGKYIYYKGLLTAITDRHNNRYITLFHDDKGNITSVHDNHDRMVTYSYRKNMLIKVSDVLGNQTSYEYNKASQLTKVTAQNKHILIDYDKSGKVASVLNSKGEGSRFKFRFDRTKKLYYVQITSTQGFKRETWFTKEGEARLVKIDGKTIQRIEKQGNKIFITDEAGFITTKEFDKNENLIKIEYPDRSVKSYEYHPKFNKRTKEINELGIITEYAYDKNGNMILKKEAKGTSSERITRYSYDDAGNLTKTKNTTMTYDAFGNMTSQTDAEGYTTKLSYDSSGNLTRKQDPKGNIWIYKYDLAGNLVMVSDPLGNTRKMIYNALGNKIMEVDANGNHNTFEYDINHNLSKIRDAQGNITLFEYNADNKLLSSKGPEGNVTTYKYDTRSRLVKTIDPAGNEISMEYQSDNTGCSSCTGSASNPSKIIYPTFTKKIDYNSRGRKTAEHDMSLETRYEYDLTGNLISKTDKNKKTTYYKYDDLNRLISITDPLSGITEYQYDSSDNLISLTDAENNTTRFEYDKNNRLIKEIRPMGQVTSYSYDSLGNLVQKTDAKNQRTQYIYNKISQLEKISYYTGKDATPVKSVTFTYDKTGHLTSYDDGITMGTYNYDTLGRKVSETINFGSFKKTNTYSYYQNGLKKTFTGSNQITYGYLYQANQLTGTQIPDNGFIRIDYKWNRPKSMTLPGGTTKTYEYDDLMRTTSIISEDQGDNTLLSYTYTYDDMDNIKTKSTEHGDYVYDYDDVYRLTKADNPDVQVPFLKDEVFTYDNVGNRLSSAGTTTPWDYNQNNELESYGDVVYIYDDNGNMIKKTVAGKVTSYVYNIEDRLAQVWDGEAGSGSLTAEYYYDPFGRRLYKEVDGVRTYFYYADEGLVAEFDAAGEEIKSYGYKPNSTWTTDPLFMKVGDEYYYYQNDHLGTPQKLIAGNGEVVWSAKYDSFGEAEIDPVSTVENNLRFPGQYEDGETGLHYNCFRYYNPEIGRYMTADPIGQAGGINLFVYVHNNPIKKTDRLGTDDWDNAYDALVDGTGPWTDPLEIDLSNIYCDYLSTTVSVCADAAAIGAAVTTALSGGVTTPITGQVAVSAKIISITNGVVTLFVCGPRLSTATSTIGTAAPGWWGVAVSTIDGALSAMGK
jgi:RHS repeat-associated protein